MFDLDVEGMLERLHNVSNVTLLVSNPCIEFWFLLHYKDYKTELTTENCIKELLVFSGKYTKGILSEQEKQILSDNMTDAIRRSMKLKKHKNPSTTIYQFIPSTSKSNIKKVLSFWVVMYFLSYNFQCICPKC